MHKRNLKFSEHSLPSKVNAPCFKRVDFTRVKAREHSADSSSAHFFTSFFTLIRIPLPKLAARRKNSKKYAYEEQQDYI